mgnify:CR=1 FL=1
MRSKEFLFEYDRSKTIDQMGNAIANTAKKDPAIGSPRIADSELSPEQVRAISRNALGQIESVDPTPNNKYVLWIVRQFVKNGLKFEDINEFLRLDLERFHELPKQRKQQLGIETDLNKYTWRDLRAVVDKLKKATNLEQPVDANLDYEHIDEMDVLYVGDMGQLIVPKTTNASCEIGSGTRWCTAATQSDNMFRTYADDGPLYVWIPSRKMQEKSKSNKFQFHFPSQQFMDENDEPISSELLKYFRTQHPVLKKVFEKGEKSLLKSVLKKPMRAYRYAARILKERWPEAEEIIMRDPHVARLYADIVINGRWPEAEEIIRKKPEPAYAYAKNVIKGEWPEAEDVIKQDPRIALFYAVYVLKRRWPEGEEAIKQHPHFAFEYAKLVLKGRWPEAEKIMKEVDPVWEQYTAFLDSISEKETTQEDVSVASSEEYDELTQKNFGNKSPAVVNLAKQSKEALQTFYPNGKLKTMKSGSGNFVTQWYETSESIFLIGINTHSRKLLKADIEDVKTFIDMLITEMQNGKTLVTSPHKKSMQMLKNVQKIAEKRGLNFSMDVSDGVSFGEDDPELEFFQVQAKIN